MRFSFKRKGSTGNPRVGVSVVIISATCCAPNMQPFDDQARLVIEKAISETGIDAQIGVMSAVKAYFGGAPKGVMAKVMSPAQSGQMPVPVILVNGRAVSYGVPQLNDMKAALLEASGQETSQPKERTMEESR